MIAYACSEGVASLHLNAPAKSNALSSGMLDELLQAVHHASNNASVHSLVLTREHEIQFFQLAAGARRRSSAMLASSQ